ncbi:hypothetical protein K461DRAFT_294579 [Myriangium duriaei CBS 260.36]|uniref:Uncharacterized protein n=1 Tax=Myriangium duriaei CBS 260.36 TaxID=1168546 RepID=A0A9P4IXY7_9PEZI|nr:hypothetical protein K461DRAFT_294579 [Myriangium duriaei CBS 260.36]
MAGCPGSDNTKAWSKMALIFDNNGFWQLHSESRGHDLFCLHTCAQMVDQIFRENGLLYAFIGGYSTVLYGSPRSVQDIDVVVEADIPEVMAALVKQKPLCLPEQYEYGFASIFVKTGLKLTKPDMNMSRTEPVQVNIVMSGYTGSPSNLDSCTQKISLPRTGVSVSILDLKTQMAQTLSAYRSRGDHKDYEDLSFMIRRYHVEITQVARHLRIQDREYLLERMTRRQEFQLANIAAQAFGFPTDDGGGSTSDNDAGEMGRGKRARLGSSSSAGAAS